MAIQITYSSARATLAELLEKATSDRVPITITRRNGEPVVLVAASEYESLRETAYLLRSPDNARRLLEALVEAEGGAGEKISIGDLKALAGNQAENSQEVRHARRITV